VAKPAPYTRPPASTNNRTSASPYSRLYQQQAKNVSNSRKPIVEDSKGEDYGGSEEPLNINIVKKETFNNKENMVSQQRRPRPPPAVGGSSAADPDKIYENIDV
jgi:hypothetical protein